VSETLKYKKKILHLLKINTVTESLFQSKRPKGWKAYW